MVTPPKEFHFPDPRTTNPRDRRMQRFYEIIPGLLTWATLLGMTLFSFISPVSVAVFIIAFDLYWIHHTVFVVYYSTVAYRRLQAGQYVPWRAWCEGTENLERLLNDYHARHQQKPTTPHEQRVWRLRRRGEKRLVQRCARITQNDVLPWRDIVHVVLLPTAGEDAEIIAPALEALAHSDFPLDRIIVVLATEEREDAAHRTAKVDALRKQFGHIFADFVVTTHVVAPGELKCKASNTTFAAKFLMTYLKEKGIAYDRVILSNFDCDSVVHPQYFAALTFLYVTDPHRLQRAYQPLPMYHNNLWDTNAFVRVIVTSSSFWHMFQSTRTQMVTFSSHSEPFATLVNVGFWPVNMISEDSIIYWKCFSYFHGRYRVEHVYLPISLDAVFAPTYVKTLTNQYKQLRRWAYGIENFPVVMRALVPDALIKASTKWRVALELLQGHHSWATAPIILAILGWLPLLFGGPTFNSTVLAHNLPLVTGTLMTIAMIGLIASLTMSLALLPPRPAHHTRWRYTTMVGQWFLAPLIAPFLGSLPAIDAQTRILMGRYFGEFWVTEKVRVRVHQEDRPPQPLSSQ